MDGNLQMAWRMAMCRTLLAIKRIQVMRRDPVAGHRRLNTTCGWTSQEIAWDRQEKILPQIDRGIVRGAWGGRLFRNEGAVQRINEEDLRAYVSDLRSSGDVSSSLDGLLHNGDSVQVRWGQVALAALPATPAYDLPCRATGAFAPPAPNLRTTVAVYRNDPHVSDSVPLMHGECLYLSTPPSTGSLLLRSEPRSFQSFAPMSERQQVAWGSEADSRTLWKVLPAPGITPPSIYVQVNETVILNHVTTNQNLTLEPQHKINTVFGPECEVTASRSGLQHLLQFMQPYDSWIFK